MWLLACEIIRRQSNHDPADDNGRQEEHHQRRGRYPRQQHAVRFDPVEDAAIHFSYAVAISWPSSRSDSSV